MIVFNITVEAKVARLGRFPGIWEGCDRWGFASGWRVQAESNLKSLSNRATSAIHHSGRPGLERALRQGLRTSGQLSSQGEYAGRRAFLKGLCRRSIVSGKVGEVKDSERL